MNASTLAMHCAWCFSIDINKTLFLPSKPDRGLIFPTCLPVLLALSEAIEMEIPIKALV